MQELVKIRLALLSLKAGQCLSESVVWGSSSSGGVVEEEGKLRVYSCEFLRNYSMFSLC